MFAGKFFSDFQSPITTDANDGDRAYAVCGCNGTDGIFIHLLVMVIIDDDKFESITRRADCHVFVWILLAKLFECDLD